MNPPMLTVLVSGSYLSVNRALLEPLLRHRRLIRLASKDVF